MGRRATALALYEDAESMAHAKKDARETVAHQLVAQLDTEASRVRIHVPRGEPGWAAMLDERPVAITNPRGFPVDPGTHTLRMIAPDASQWSALIRVDETPEGSEGLVIDVDVPEPRTASPPHNVKTTWGRVAAPDPDPSRGSTQRAVAVGVGAFGVVGLGVGAYFGIRAKSMQDASNAPGGGCNSASDVCNPYGQALRTSALDSATASTVLFAVSASAIATGIVLYVTAPSKGDLTVAFDAMSASLRGRF
jgi:serine/threonine-protein kinase